MLTKRDRPFGQGDIWAAVAAAILVCDVAAAAQNPRFVAREARQLDWSSRGLSQLQEFFGADETVKAFLYELLSEKDGADVETIASVKEYRLVDVNGDGRVELVALADVSGRAFYNNIAIVCDGQAASSNGRVRDEFRGFVV